MTQGSSAEESESNGARPRATSATDVEEKATLPKTVEKKLPEEATKASDFCVMRQAIRRKTAQPREEIQADGRSREEEDMIVIAVAVRAASAADLKAGIMTPGGGREVEEEAGIREEVTMREAEVDLIEEEVHLIGEEVQPIGGKEEELLRREEVDLLQK